MSSRARSPWRVLGCVPAGRTSHGSTRAARQRLATLAPTARPGEPVERRARPTDDEGRVRRSTHRLPLVLTALLLAAALAALPARPLASQDTVTRPDTARRAPRDTGRARALETVTVRAVRGGDAAVAQTTLGAAALARGYTGQDVPLLLQQAPGVTAYAQSGGGWNYSYFRLRGIDQSRINLTLDGVPLNEPEDQQLYFSNFADLANSVASIQIQRGVGTSSYGQASYGGSVNFETVPLSAAGRSGEMQLGGGSFGARRAAVEYATGLGARRTAAYARFANQRADGYRRGSSHAGNSAFASAGYFGDRDLVKVTLLTGAASNGQAYTPVPLDALRADPRANPIAGVGDRFRQTMAALAYTRLLSATTSVATTVYGFDAGGWYEYPTWVAATAAPRWELASRWGGVVSALRHASGGRTIDVGVHALDYRRDHRFAERTDLEAPGYANRGAKREASAFVKASQAIGPFTAYGDLQLRTASFRYLPTPGDGVAPASVAWRFVNPRLGVSWQANAHLRMFAAAGATGREPTRADLLEGEDNVSPALAARVFPLDRVRPEQVRNVEAGAEWRAENVAVRANAYTMQFRDEITLVGATAMLGADLRDNVPTSFRRGVELDATWVPAPALTLAATLAASHNRVRSWHDAESGRTYRDVPPVLTPALVAGQQLTWRVHRAVALTADGRYQSRQQLDLSAARMRSAPAFFVLDGGARVQVRRHALLVQGRNLLDRLAFTAGDVSDGVPRYFVLAPRSVEVTARVTF